MGEIVQEEQIHNAVAWLRDNATALAQAKAYKIYCEEYRKSLKAILFNQFEGTMAVRENLAYADPKYLDHLKQLENAVFEFEKLNALKIAAQIKIEVWRSEGANLRAIKL